MCRNENGLPNKVVVATLCSLLLFYNSLSFLKTHKRSAKLPLFVMPCPPQMEIRTHEIICRAIVSVVVLVVPDLITYRNQIPAPYFQCSARIFTRNYHFSYAMVSPLYLESF